MLRQLTSIVVFTCSALASGLPHGGTFRACSASGWGSDAGLNRQKNRALAVENARWMTVAEVNSLPVPHNIPANRRHWSREIRAQIARFEAQGAIVEGYVLGVNSESMEAANCFRPDLHDFHLWIGVKPTDKYNQALIAEISPRWHAANHAWSKKNLEALAREHAKVRVTGWLMIDQPHVNDIPRERASVWEVHPITRIEVLSNGEWVELAPGMARMLLASDHPKTFGKGLR